MASRAPKLPALRVEPVAEDGPIGNNNDSNNNQESSASNWRSGLQSPRGPGAARRSSTGGFSGLSWGDKAYQRQRQILGAAPIPTPTGGDSAAAQASLDHAAEQENSAESGGMAAGTPVSQLGRPRGPSFGSEVEAWGTTPLGGAQGSLGGGGPAVGSYARSRGISIGGGVVGSRAQQRRASAFVPGSQKIRLELAADTELEVDPEGRSHLLQSPPVPRGELLAKMFSLDNALGVSRSRRSSLAIPEPEPIRLRDAEDEMRAAQAAMERMGLGGNGGGDSENEEGMGVLGPLEEEPEA